MVFGHNGDWHILDLAAKSAIQQLMDLLGVGHDVLPQHLSVLPVLGPLDYPICHVPGSFHDHETELAKVTAAWLLPIVAPIVASGSGGIVAEVLLNPQHAVWTVTISYILWGTGFPLAMVVLVVYFHRLTIQGLHPKEMIVSVFLPLGPLGQGSFALLQLGKVCARVLPQTGNFEPDSGNMIHSFTIVIALIIWGYGLVWFFFAVASIT
ncbi:sulfite transporter Ssu2 [Phlyctema vagabunda]|uniref:Sulfite transporter Ssu2 n=1 Tax=Phlyctema vagabunda TaxID=108571 RepID=A0ABR4P5Z5_9HELO